MPEEAAPKLKKWQVGYLPVAPPPAFFIYQCGRCAFWEAATRTCQKVDGPIAAGGWCFLWKPGPNEKPLRWLFGGK